MQVCIPNNGHQLTVTVELPGNICTNQEETKLIQQSDIALFGTYFTPVWVNASRLATIYGGQTEELVTTSDIIFPFARLASVTLADQSTTFLYHQINSTTFAEEQWDTAEGAWLDTEYIIVSDS